MYTSIDSKNIISSEMPQTIVKIDNTMDKWGLIELQGTLECPDSVQLQNAHIGDLHIDKSGTPQLIIGHHILTGKIQKLEKPFGVMKKSGPNVWNIKSIIEEKYIFKVRPKPIIEKAT